MPRFLLLIVLALVAASFSPGCEEDTIVQPKSEVERQFPNVVGSWYIYDYRDSIDTIHDTVTVRITGQKLLPNGDVAKVWIKESDIGNESLFVAQEGDTVRLYFGTFSSPITLILPLEIGNFWSIGPLSIDTTTVTDSSLWSLLPGSLRSAFRVHRKWDVAGYREEDVVWILPEVGLVALTMQALSIKEDAEPLEEYWLLLDYHIPD